MAVEDLLMEFHMEKRHVQLICNVPQLLPDVSTKIDFLLLDGFGNDHR